MVLETLAAVSAGAMAGVLAALVIMAGIAGMVSAWFFTLREVVRRQEAP